MPLNNNALGHALGRLGALRLRRRRGLGTAPARTRAGARFEEIAARLEVSGETLRLVAKWFADTAGDLHATIGRRKPAGPSVPSPVAGEVEARLIKLASSAPPQGHLRWSLRFAGQACSVFCECRQRHSANRSFDAPVAPRVSTVGTVWGGELYVPLTLWGRSRVTRIVGTRVPW
jgi:hypothetical protein